MRGSQPRINALSLHPASSFVFQNKSLLMVRRYLRFNHCLHADKNTGEWLKFAQGAFGEKQNQKRDAKSINQS